MIDDPALILSVVLVLAGIGAWLYANRDGPWFNEPESRTFLFRTLRASMAFVLGLWLAILITERGELTSIHWITAVVFGLTRLVWDVFDPRSR